jgi:peptide/nickel transport system substrate-binding protein
MKKMRLTAMALALIIAGCAQPDSQPGSSSLARVDNLMAVKKRVAASIRGEPATLSAIIDSSGVGGTAGLAELEELLHVGLAEIVDNRVVTRPRLAESVPSLQNGQWKAFPDGRMELTWKLRADAQWHDGTPVTSADLLFTAQVGQDQDLTILSNNAYKFVESVDAPDATTVVVTWNRPFILADTMFSNGFALPLPRHLLEEVYQRDKEAFSEHPYWTEGFIGAGPFKLREFVRSSHAILEANDRYVLGRPRIDEIEVKFLNDPSVIVANVLSGAIDMSLGRGLAPEQAFEAERQWSGGKVDSAYSTSWTAIYPQFIDPNPPAIANLHFRRALLVALDRQQIVNSLAMGKTRVVSSYIGPNSPEFRDVQPQVIEYAYDQRRAIEMIQSLGFNRAQDGMLYDGGGRALALEIRTTAGDELRSNAMFAVADMWKAIGIGMEALIVPRQRASDREYRVTRPGFELTHQPNELTERALQRFQTKEIPTAQNNWRGNNRARYSSTEYDGLVDRYVVTLEARDRLELAKQINQHIAEQLPALGLLYRIDLMLVGDRLNNVSAETSVRNAHEWDIKVGTVVG